MWVSSLEINNIKSFEASGTISFDKKMNILLGANNSGKSTILRALYFVQNASILRSSDIRIGSSNTTCSIVLEDMHDNETMRTMENAGYTSMLQITGNMGGSLQVTMVNADRTQRASVSIPQVEPQNFIYPYLSKRKVPTYRREINRNYLLEVSDTLINLVPKVDQLATKYYTKHEEFEQACIDILGFPIATFLAADNSGKQVGIMVNDYDNIPIEAMGEGVPNLLGLIVSLCMAKNKLFLIEELENDIHPRALKSLLELIIKKAEYNQFVISTHSNIVARYLGSVPGSKIHYVSLAPYTPQNRIPTAIYKEVGNTPQERREVLEDLGYDIVDYDLAKGWIFFEESSAEKIIRDFLIPWFIPQLKEKVKTVAAQGTSDVEPRFNDFNRLFVFLHLEEMYKNRAWVIVDGETSGKKTIERLRATYVPNGWDETKFITFSQDNFEQYYPDRFSEDAKAALTINNKDAKREAKRLLLKKVIVWIAADEHRAKDEFEKSADEVIVILQKIEAKL